jgi:hypothetical protein
MNLYVIKYFGECLLDLVDVYPNGAVFVMLSSSSSATLATKAKK